MYNELLYVLYFSMVLSLWKPCDSWLKRHHNRAHGRPRWALGDRFTRGPSPAPPSWSCGTLQPSWVEMETAQCSKTSRPTRWKRVLVWTTPMEMAHLLVWGHLWVLTPSQVPAGEWMHFCTFFYIFVKFFYNLQCSKNKSGIQDVNIVCQFDQFRVYTGKYRLNVL